MTTDRGFLLTVEALSAVVGLTGLGFLSFGLYRLTAPGGTDFELLYAFFGAVISLVSFSLFLVCHGWNKRLRAP